MKNTVFFEIIKILLLPLALIYGIIVRIRNTLYDKQIYKSVRFEIPVISIGNLSVGGTGKTPHIEYLIDLLNPYFKIATLSRGYGRKTRGFIVAGADATALTIGDEPMQFKRKFEDVIVTVGESRMLAIPEMLGLYPGIELILMDDGYQHRSVNPGLSILLSDYNNLFTRDRVLPLGRLREPAAAYKRADIIIITKCPLKLNSEERRQIIEEIKPLKYQKVYFTYLVHGQAYSLVDPMEKLDLNKEVDILALTGIASNDSMIRYLQEQSGTVISQDYGDHHYFDRYNLENIRDTFEGLNSKKRAVIVTTEKDAVRLELNRHWLLLNKLPVFVLPVKIFFFPEDENLFRKDIFSFMEYYINKDATG